MTLFDDVLKPTKPQPSTQWSVPEAVAAVLVSAMLSDGEVSAGEAKWTNYELPSLRIFQSLGPDEFRAMTRSVFEEGRRVGAEALLAAAALAVPPELRAFTFANAVDLVLADEDVPEAERAFIDQVGATLGVEPDLARRIIEVLVVKHGLVS
jgi:uncharacterized tellurite resistance protein B-like protein